MSFSDREFQSGNHCKMEEEKFWSTKSFSESNLIVSWLASIRQQQSVSREQKHDADKPSICKRIRETWLHANLLDQSLKGRISGAWFIEKRGSWGKWLQNLLGTTRLHCTRWEVCHQWGHCHAWGSDCPCIVWCSHHWLKSLEGTGCWCGIH
jgi:hypothetical protein